MYRIAPGQAVLIDGVAFRMHQITTDGCYVFENCATRAPLSLTKQDLSGRLSAGTFELTSYPKDTNAFDPGRADFHGLNQGLKNTAYRRHRYIQALQALALPKNKKRLKPALAKLAADFGDTNPPSPDSVIRWLNRWEMSGARDIRSLVPMLHRRGNRRRRVDSNVLDLIEVVIDEFYYRREKTTTISVHEIVCGKIRASNERQAPAYHLPFPSLATVRRAIADRSPYEVMAARKGKHEAKLKFMPVNAAPKATRPLEVVEIDHTILDLHLVDNQTGVLIGRPTMTAAIDKFSRLIVGFYLGYEPAANHTVMQCLRHSILNKQYVRDLYPDIKNVWPCEGIPTTIVVDNGPEFHSAGFTSACAQLGINTTYAPGRSPWYKSAIERFFGVLNTSLLHQVPGTTFSRSAQRGDYNSEKAAAISLSDLQHLIHIWLIDYYAQRIPRNRGQSPIQIWTKGVEAHGLTPPRSMSDLDCLLGGFETRTLSRRGIEINNLIYCCEKIFDLLNRPSPPKTVEVRYDHSDLSYVLIRDPITQAYIRIPSIEPEYTTGLTLEQHELAKKRANKQKQGQLTVGDLSAARLHIQNKVDDAVSQNRSLRQMTSKQLKRLRMTEATQPAFATPAPTRVSSDPANDSTSSTGARAPSRDQITFESEE